jgi:hypothetical protein
MRTIAWRMLATAALIALTPPALLALAVPAWAQSPSQAQASAIRQACRADYQSHCASVPTGGSASLQCLQQNATALSTPCQQALAAIGGAASPSPPPTAQSPNTLAPTASTPTSRRAEITTLRTDCRADYRKFCATVQPGGGRALGCLQAHGAQLSRQCQSALLTAQQSR